MCLFRLDLEISFEEYGTLVVINKFIVWNVIPLRLNEVFDHTIFPIASSTPTR